MKKLFVFTVKQSRKVKSVEKSWNILINFRRGVTDRMQQTDNPEEQKS